MIGFLAGMVLGLAGKAEHVTVVASLLGYLVSIPVSILVLRHILEKGYKHFRIVLIPTRTEEVELTR